MTQKELEDKLREIKMVYSDRARDLIQEAQPKLDDITKKKAVVIEEFNKAREELEKSLSGLKEIGNELRRKGFANYSKEIENNTKDKDNIKGKLRELRADFQREVQNLNALYKSYTHILNHDLSENSKMRAQAKHEVMLKLEKKKEETL